MKYEADIDGRQVTLEVEQRNGQVTAKIGERSYSLKVISPESGVYLIFDGDNVYEARVSPAEADALRVKVRDRVFTANIIDRKRRRSASEHGAEGQQPLTAPMPGKVVRILVEADSEVAAGQGVVVVEAMKMQNEIKSPKAGRVTEIRVSEGDAVSAGQVLAIVE
ncbi:MAG TPA: biotin/lipoyl-containing protein [Blastocatellia bacterium]|nr:biotin/lipoyl-containing protein [Blastocatellia bacterium]